MSIDIPMSSAGGSAALMGGTDLFGFLNRVHAKTGAKTLTIAYNLDVPIGCGPYRIAEYVRASHLKLEAFKDYWQGEPKITNVIFKFVLEPTSRVAEIESGRSDMTLEIPFEEWFRLRDKPGLKVIAQPISEVALIFLEERGPFADENLRLAAHHAINKEAIVKRLFLGFGRQQSTLEAREYEAHIPDYYFPYDMDLARSYMAKTGFSPKNPVKIKFQTTNGWKAKDYELVQAITAMWKKIGIEAEIEVLELAKLFELRYAGKLADSTFYMWGNSSGDPENSTGFAMFGPAPFNVFDSPDVDKMIGPLFKMLDEKKRIEEYKKVVRYVIDHGMIIPLFQAVMPIVMKSNVQFTPYANGWILPHKMDIT